MIYVISDVHGNIEGLERALFKARIIDAYGNRQMPRKNKVISIGDLANCVKDSAEGDHACLDMVGGVIDYMLIGNHEMGYFDPNNDFAGFHYWENIHRRLRELNDLDLILPAWLHGATLITHAGLSKQLIRHTEQDAYSEYKRIHEHWDAANYNHSLFSSVGRCRGGRHNCGGILWCDFHSEFVPTNFPQIIGHSSSGRNVKIKHNALCIDVGAKDPKDNDPFILEVRD